MPASRSLRWHPGTSGVRNSIQAPLNAWSSSIVSPGTSSGARSLNSTLNRLPSPNDTSRMGYGRPKSRSATAQPSTLPNREMKRSRYSGRTNMCTRAPSAAIPCWVVAIGHPHPGRDSRCMELSPFRIERFYARYEHSTRFMLSSSDCESRTVGDLLELEPDAHERLLETWCGYTESPGGPGLRQAIGSLCGRAGAEELA